MKVIIATTVVPFVRGGAEYLADSLSEALRESGHAVEKFDFPFHSDHRTMVEQMTALRLLDLSGCGDRLIALRTPSYLINHHRKVIWFIHHHRPAFDLWGTCFQDLPNSPRGIAWREAFRSADNTALREAAAVFVNSRRMAERVREYNSLEADVLYPPLRRAHGLFARAYGDYILCPGRLIDHKRQHLFIEAIQYTTSPVRLVLVGPSDSDSYTRKIHRLAETTGVADRVSVFPHWMPEEEKSELYANALAVGYAPYDEDSYGYVTLEAAHSRKAVITCNDSGGVLDFVEDGQSGLVAEARPDAIAACLDRIWSKTLARRLGSVAFERIAALGISWDRVLLRLLA
jgi:glycosyltransferase involved in cell wall biosynthesis